MMEKRPLTLQNARDMMLYVSRKILEHTEVLTQADKAIGDGDHGIGMARGFEAVINKIEGQEFSSINQLFGTIGTTLLMSIGGAAGAVFGTLFRGMGKQGEEADHINVERFSSMLLAGLMAVKERGKAQQGDKTMVDALEPAVLESQKYVSSSFDEALTAMTEAARRGMEETKNMTAAVGKAKTLGERSLGHPDPGAISMYLILQGMLEYVRNNL